tara:strand:- start:202 stop:756 length:555 start_codon:yes stop_codon:yes gene_type:complete
MIIRCNNCNKIFEADSSLIPANGRLVQCSGCDHKWFFKKTITDKAVPIVKINTPIKKEEPLNEIIAPFSEGMVSEEKEISDTMELLDKVTEDASILEKNSIKNKAKKNEVKVDDKEIDIKTFKNKKNYNILGLTVVFIISFVALIIVIDTFKNPISKIIPNIEFLLYNLYETINDIILFFRDLI